MWRCLIGVIVTSTVRLFKWAPPSQFISQPGSSRQRLRPHHKGAARQGLTQSTRHFSFRQLATQTFLLRPATPPGSHVFSDQRPVRPRDPVSPDRHRPLSLRSERISSGWETAWEGQPRAWERRAGRMRTDDCCPSDTADFDQRSHDRVCCRLLYCSPAHQRSAAFLW